MDLQGDHWGGGIFEILELTESTNSDDLTISGRGSSTAYHVTIQKNGRISVVGKSQFPYKCVQT